MPKLPMLAVTKRVNISILHQHNCKAKTIRTLFSLSLLKGQCLLLEFIQALIIHKQTYGVCSPETVIMEMNLPEWWKPQLTCTARSSQSNLTAPGG